MMRMTQQVNLNKMGRLDDQIKVGVRELYREYRENTSGELLDYETYVEVLKEFNSGIVKEIILNAYEFVAPHRIGRFRIKKYKRDIKLYKNGDVDKRKMPVDWPKTKALWKTLYPGLDKDELKQIPNKQIVYQLNEHSDGYSFYMFWERLNSNIRNSRMYSFRTTYTNNRFLCNMIKDNQNINYYE